MQLQPPGTVMPPLARADRAEALYTPAPPAVAADSRNPVQQAEPASHLGQVDDAVKTINKTMQALSPGLEFSIDSDTKQIVIKVVDTETREVIRQMPTVEALEIAKALDRLQGLLIRQKA